ncbi:MAG: hypothetical protein QXG35_02420 [Nitrososphaerota archaeon]
MPAAYIALFSVENIILMIVLATLVCIIFLLLHSRDWGKRRIRSPSRLFMEGKHIYAFVDVRNPMDGKMIV